MFERVDIESYIELYGGGITLDKIKPLHNQTYKIFKSSNSDVRIVNRRDTYKNPLAFSKIKKLVNENEYFYMVPVTTIKGTIVGFILRGLFKHSYNTVSRNFSSCEKQIPLMFGFDKSFLTYDSHEKCYPIIVCEGSKDCMVLKKIYPYVLSNNTSSMGMNANVLRNISDKFILAYDNDKAGQEGIARDKKILRGMGAYVDNLVLPEEYKDCSDCVIRKDGTVNKKEYEKLKTQVKKRVKALLNI